MASAKPPRPLHNPLQAALVDLAAVDRIAQAGDTTIQRLSAVFKEYHSRTLFGIPDRQKPQWTPVTYGDVWERIQVRLRLYTGADDSASKPGTSLRYLV